MKALFLLNLLALMALCGHAQSSGVVRVAPGHLERWGKQYPLAESDERKFGADSLLYVADTLLLVMKGANCKSKTLMPFFVYNRLSVSDKKTEKQKSIPPHVAPRRIPLLTVHGNVMYDMYYQSHVDTPYMERDVYQHTVQTVLDITVKDRYPLHLAFSTNMGNSSHFRNFTGLHLRYSNRDLKNSILGKAKSWDAGRLKQKKELEDIRMELDGKWQQLSKLKAWFSEPSRIQQMVEAKEKELYGTLPIAKRPVFDPENVFGAFGKLSHGNRHPQKIDSSVHRLLEAYDRKKSRMDSLQQEIAKLDQLYRQKQQAYGSRRTVLTDVLIKSGNNKELADNLEAMGLPDSILPKGYRQLLAIRSIGIGRMMADYSDLTVKNISMTGFQAEYNPSYYVAFATGAVDYRFRDFVVSSNRVKQYVSVVRAGLGMREGNNIIFSFYAGKKQLYNFNTTTPAGDPVQAPDYKIMGMSVEGRWQLNKNNYLTAEAAKSSLPYYQRAGKNESVPGTMVSFNDRSNEAYALSVSSVIPSLGTRLSGTYKVMGANFQSFSLYASGSSQHAWMVKADQPFFRRQLTITASMRKNVFSSLFEHAGYQSSTIFKSIQATFRRRSWPVMTVGYFPSSQLMKLGDDQFVENLFYTLVGNVSHFYQYRGISMNTVLSATRFYNRQIDSNFIYFNSTSLVASQTIFLSRLTLNASLSSAINRDYAVHGADGGASLVVNKWLEAGGGLKYNYQTVYSEKYWGYNANLRVKVPKVGEIAFLGDKGFVPGVGRKLVPSNAGRITFTKIF